MSNSYENVKEFSIEVPERFSEGERKNSKMSYHKSGQVHIKDISNDGTTEYDKVAIWKNKNDINQPHRIYSLITARLKHYDEIVKEPKINVNKNQYSIVLPFDGDDIPEKRLFFEFYLSPEGVFDLPNAMFSTQKLPYVVTHSLSPNLVLVITFGLIGDNVFGDWHPEIAISIIGEMVKDTE